MRPRANSGAVIGWVDARVVQCLVNRHPKRAWNAAVVGCIAADDERRLKVEMSPLGPGYLLCEFHGGAEIPVLAYDDRDLVPLLICHADQIDGETHIHALLLPARVDSSAIDVDTLRSQIPKLVAPEPVPELLVCPAMRRGDSRVETDLFEFATGNAMDELGRQFLHVVAWIRVDGARDLRDRRPSVSRSMVEILAVEENDGSHTWLKMKHPPGVAIAGPLPAGGVEVTLSSHSTCHVSSIM